MDLDKWIEKTTKDIKAAQDLVQKILDEVNGNAKQKDNLGDLDKAIETVESKLQERVAELTKWKDAASRVLEGTIDSSGKVYKDLDPSKKEGPGETTKIGEGIKKIEDAKKQVESVNGELQTVHKDLQAWNLAAKDVLDKVVQKAQDVHKRLDPNQKDDQHKIGTNIGLIDNARQGLDEANKTLGIQVKALDTWITQAEDIRAAAEKKAREAYDKLKVNKTLDLNVKKIVEANKKIEGVHGKLGGVEKSLGEWKQQAQGVLGRAIRNANEVYERLESEIGAKTTAIGSHNSEIQKANTQLATHVTSLQQWNSAAQGVITKAEGKCAQILEKVKTTDQKSVIFTQAEKLRDEGTRLLKAAEQAKKAVEAKVSEALEAVVNMDGDLKRDLKGVRDAIKKQIWSKIEEFQVTKLDNLVKGDLWTLKERIEGLGKGLNTDDKSQPLVKQALEDLAAQKTLLDAITSDTNGSIPKETRNLENKFNNAIKDPLTQAVSAVDQAIGTLGGKFGVSGEEDKKKLEKIFGHIKGKVGEIKGTPKKGGTNGSGLEGIKSKVEDYFNAFNGSKFKNIVKGWLEDVLKHNGAVRMMVGRKGLYEESEKSNIENVAKEVRDALGGDATTAGKKVVDGNNGADGGTQKIHAYVNAVKQGCDAFADALDKKLHNNGFSGIYSEVKQKMQDNSFKPTKCICESVGCAKCNGGRNSHGKDCKEKAFIAAVFCALTAVSRQVGNELKSVLLEPKDGNNIAGILDTITPIATTLNEQLTAATATNQSTDPNEIPAQAVDSTLQAVRSEVDGLVDKFNSQVKKPLEDAVKELPGAVSTFNQKAEAQIKNAVKTDPQAVQLVFYSSQLIKALLFHFLQGERGVSGGVLNRRAQLLEFLLHLLNVLCFYGHDVCGDLSEAFVCLTFICPRCVTVIKAMFFQILQLFGDLSVQLLSEVVKLIRDLVDALADGIGLVVQYALLTLKFFFDFREAFFTFTFNGPCFSCT
ncbi:Extracellular matrix-binding ebh, putative [Babesia ovata]|uniref:Extracellular matrix-binding ebh, putative n=1 Tax=Babesia ovata TaxID=189622 RepID=A0A2H6KDP1_9APIC|nr:Extracellular matrix-binding ebh, putative [Babesia ovata]GBE61107.1 Extracellular matrix-binding ebh, putative [Babesia ovata]